ncbi:MAG: thioether cross-link-forming SCIFF peptide maturase [Defluviitaleaceae bacterium]|nr:thioether cross-link-forming SCIFF peptide maturase [Defluviitaleaceae bacterium]
MIHCFSVNGRHLVLDIASGALHAVDDAAYLVLCALQGMPDGEAAEPEMIAAKTGLATNTVKEALKEIRQLVDMGQLFTHTSEADVHVYMRNRRPVIKALCLHMAHECNLRCGYCFAGQGDYGQDRGLMSLETGRKALDFLIAQSGSRRNLEVDFFGGEPMLNFDTVKALVAYGRAREKETGKRFRFTLTTNGALLTDEDHPYINENMDNVVLSLDGRPEVNDCMRKLTANKNGSYDVVYPKIKALADSRNHERYYVRGTYTRHNLDFAADVLHMADVGFTQLSVEPVVAPPGVSYSLREEDLPALYAEYEKLADALLARERDGKPVNFFHFMMDLSGGPCLAKRVTGCGAGSEYLAITPSGKLFPCHQFVGDDKFCLGDLDTGIVNSKIVSDFAGCHVYSKPACRDCWARYYCSGGCMATAYNTHGDINQPDKISCDLQRKRIECALYMKAARHVDITQK